MPLLTLLERGTAAAKEAADAFLRDRARRLWERATWAAPAAALELSLRTIRVEEERDASDSVAWAPAWQLAVAPRQWVRLLGLTERGWPRSSGEDPLLPEHIVPPGTLEADPRAEADRRAFGIIAACATHGIVLSRSRRNAQGGRTGPSPLLPPGTSAIALARTRIAEHAASELDRLASRPQDVTEHPAAGSALRCWQSWHTQDLSAHDGLVVAGHAVIAESIAELQSPTSLTRLLRDPLGFVWKYALGWRAPDDRACPLILSPDEFGRLVHELLRRAVDALEPTPGFTVARTEEIEDALNAAVRHVITTWPLERPVPPEVLWVNTVRQAAAMALAGLTGERFTESGTRSWTEVPFGEHFHPPEQTNLGWPWDPALRVGVPGTAVAIRGKIDRVDLRAGAIAVRVTDYKTGAQPENVATTVIAGGAELQRVLYGLACRQLLPATPAIRTPAHLSERRAGDLPSVRSGRLDCADRGLCERGLRCTFARPRCSRSGYARPSQRSSSRASGISSVFPWEIGCLRGSRRRSCPVLGVAMIALVDSADRRRALTALDQTLLVEAAAGTGKTSLLAGHVTMLLADGVEPRNIAAITFTELAAGELRARVERFVNELLNGTIPDDLALAVGEALTVPPRAALSGGRARLDELTATTIHGFCHKLASQLCGRGRYRSRR